MHIVEVGRTHHSVVLAPDGYVAAEGARITSGRGVLPFLGQREPAFSAPGVSSVVLEMLLDYYRLQRWRGGVPGVPSLRERSRGSFASALGGDGSLGFTEWVYLWSTRGLEVFFVRRPERKLLFEWGVILTLADLGIQAIWQPKFNRLYWAAVQEAFEEKGELPRLECGATELVLNDRVIGSTSRGAWPAEVRFLPASVRRKKPVGKDPH